MDWAELYRQNTTPWDMGGAHPELARRLDEAVLAPAPAGTRVLVPGCGRGHDALALAAAGFQVTAIDIVEQLATQVEPGLGASGGRFLTADALAFREAHALLFAHTFFCALPPELRGRYGEMAAACVESGGERQAIVFPLDKEPRGEGPPFQMTLEDLVTALGEAFELLEDAPIPTRPERPWLSRWARFRRR